ncbi:DUF3277 family protein [Escherichia coli]
MATYSFLDVTASLIGPTGVIDLGQGSANSEEGITQTMGGNKNTMTIGADGEVMHSLHADKSGTITVTNDVTASGISVATHKHGGVQTGGGTTGGPQ